MVGHDAGAALRAGRRVEPAAAQGAATRGASACDGNRVYDSISSVSVSRCVCVRGGGGRHECWPPMAAAMVVVAVGTVGIGLTVSASSFMAAGLPRANLTVSGCTTKSYTEHGSPARTATPGARSGRGVGGGDGGGVGVRQPPLGSRGRPREAGGRGSSCAGVSAQAPSPLRQRRVWLSGMSCLAAQRQCFNSSDGTPLAHQHRPGQPSGIRHCQAPLPPFPRPPPHTHTRTHVHNPAFSAPTAKPPVRRQPPQTMHGPPAPPPPRQHHCHGGFVRTQMRAHARTHARTHAPVLSLPSFLPPSDSGRSTCLPTLPLAASFASRSCTAAICRGPRANASRQAGQGREGSPVSRASCHSGWWLHHLRSRPLATCTVAAGARVGGRQLHAS